MSLDQLLAALQREAQAEADRLLADAREDAARRAAVTEAAVAREREESLGAHAREQQAELEATLSAARLNARREVLEARERLLERVFAGIRGASPRAIAREEFIASLPGRIASALACVDPEEAIVLTVHPAIAAAVSALHAEDPRLTMREDPAIGSGFRAATADGTVEVIDTLEARMAAQHEPLARRALAQLGVEA
jgi:vacuolar-type H+-ATPase subunit E/Vma4